MENDTLIGINLEYVIFHAYKERVRKIYVEKRLG